MPWFKRFGLHLVAAIGATGVFVAAGAVGAMQTRQEVRAHQTAVTAASTRPFFPRRLTPLPAPTRPPQAVAVAPDGPPLARPTESPRADLAPGGPPMEAPTPSEAARSNAPRPARPPGAPTHSPEQVAPRVEVTPPREATPEATPEPTGTRAPRPTRTPDATPGAPATAAAERRATVAAERRATVTAERRATATAAQLEKERSLAGILEQTEGGTLRLNVRGVDWEIEVPGTALVRLAGRSVPLSALRRGDHVVILGRALSAHTFRAHAVTARRG